MFRARLCIAVILFGFVAHLSATGEAALFTRYIRNLKYRQPLSFTARLTGSAVSGRLASIPEDAIKKDHKPVVMVYSKRYAGQVIFVEHVDTVFRKMFSLYNNYINMTGMYIMSKGETWQAFSRQYTMEITSVTSSAWIVKIKSKNHPPGSHGLFSISRSDLMIRDAVFYSRGSRIYKVGSRYQRIGRYLMPSAITIQRIRDGVAQKPAKIIFSGYKLNIPVPQHVF